MGLAAPTGYIFGGVDSRSNPLNRPIDRALRCRDFIPDEAGFLRLRYGYGTITMSAVVASAIHSMWEYKLWDGTRYLVFVQGTSLKRLAMATGTVTTLGTLSSSAQCSFDYSDNKLWIVNGTDNKFYDGTTLRDIGIDAVTATQLSLATIREVLRSPTAAEATAAAVASNAAGGSQAATTNTGYQVYFHFLDASKGYSFGPATAIGSRVTHAAGATNKIDITGLPTPSNANWVKIFSRTEDGNSISRFAASDFKTVTAISYNSGTQKVTLTAAAHGWSAGDVVECRVTGWEGVFTITATTVNTFTYEDLVHNGISTAGLTGTAYKLITAANATATASLTQAGGNAVGNIVANAETGLAASTVTSSTPGYLIYASIYNPTTGHAGNRRAITGRLLPGTAGTRAIFYVEGMSLLSGVDSEFRWLFGRTGDGAMTPYAIADSAVNWQYIDNARANFVIREAAIDGAAELPSTNDKPSGLKLIKRVGSRMYAVKDASPYVFFTPDNGDTSFVGKAEQCWFADSFETFPTGEQVIAIDEHEQSLAAFSANNGALLVDLSGVLGWSQTTAVGIAGQRAFTSTPYGEFWVSGERQIIKIGADGPTPISEEYEKGTLSRIGSNYLSTTEIAYLKDAAKGLDRLVVNCKDSNGTPFQVYHDFKLRDGRSPEGQGYESVFLGALASSFTMKQVRDANGKMRIWCGGTDGQIYELETGANDNGTDFTAEWITLANMGEDNKANPWDQWYGDSQLKVYLGQDLNTTLTNIQEDAMKLKIQKVPGGASNFKFAVTRKSDRVESPQYIRLALTSHPTDALVDGVASPTDPMALNTVPHLPVEDYGRIYSVQVALA